MDSLLAEKCMETITMTLVTTIERGFQTTTFQAKVLGYISIKITSSGTTTIMQHSDLDCGEEEVECIAGNPMILKTKTDRQTENQCGKHLIFYRHTSNFC